MNRIERIFQILDIVKNEELTIKQIRIKLKADDATIYRDVKLLQKMNKIKIACGKVFVVY